MTSQMDGQLSMQDLGLWSGKTYLEHSVQTEEPISKPSSRRLPKSQSQTLPMCLCLTRESGAKPDASTMRWEDGPLLGDFTMHSFGEQPKRLMDECLIEEPHKDVSVSHLSQILEDYQHQKSYSSEEDYQRYMSRYYLSAKACQGILNRAAKRGKELPDVLKKALENQISRGSDSQD